MGKIKDKTATTAATYVGQNFKLYQKDKKERQSRMGKIKDKTATTAATYLGQNFKLYQKDKKTKKRGSRGWER